ncbi:hypothetical protein AVEN_117602-1 [Araneus ventricosus]|uniref:Uncharacterized protein n=1 Tax=Araneus ventricosus TaxID=182803 RepID=A0A4Y2G8J8_ARAVE|nr:hypothetical protein AVEN_117602-1 [Araneus ventricosus]
MPSFDLWNRPHKKNQVKWNRPPPIHKEPNNNGRELFTQTADEVTVCKQHWRTVPPPVRLQNGASIELIHIITTRPGMKPWVNLNDPTTAVNDVGNVNCAKYPPLRAGPITWK